MGPLMDRSSPGGRIQTYEPPGTETWGLWSCASPSPVSASRAAGGKSKLMRLEAQKNSSNRGFLPQRDLGAVVLCPSVPCQRAPRSGGESKRMRHQARKNSNRGFLPQRDLRAVVLCPSVPCHCVLCSRGANPNLCASRRERTAATTASFHKETWGLWSCAPLSPVSASH
ncbi:hypothetical protein NDU88_001077 [Pleurodeles waltl]|uniref:Uncharacterized protein n=1 Tax=Pleurodeles waltl TaxID=8319 RepID=A0AAV7SYK1_PLEWA|nr:hypothetical protein NDU88_001077 [Pleurodeles waltl]